MISQKRLNQRRFPRGTTDDIEKSNATRPSCRRFLSRRVIHASKRSDNCIYPYDRHFTSYVYTYFSSLFLKSTRIMMRDKSFGNKKKKTVASLCKHSRHNSAILDCQSDTAIETTIRGGGGGYTCDRVSKKPISPRAGLRRAYRNHDVRHNTARGRMD